MTVDTQPVSLTRFPPQRRNRLCKHIKWRLYVTDAYQQTAPCDPCRSLAPLSRRPGEQEKTDAASRAATHLDHLVAVRLGISSRHGEDPDLLRLGAAVGQGQRHLPVGGAVCGVGPGNSEEHQSQTSRNSALGKR